MSEQPETKTPETEPPKKGRTVEEVMHDVEADIRGAIGKWVGAKPEDDWDTIGRLMEANLRGRMAEMVGAEPGEGQAEVTWDDIGHKLDTNLRKTVGGWAGAGPEDDWETIGKKMDAGIRASMSEAVGEKPASREEAASWEAIGKKIEVNIRRGIGGWVGADPDADWEAIGDLFGERLRNIFGGKGAEEAPAPEKKTQIPISGAGEAKDETKPEV